MNQMLPMPGQDQMVLMQQHNRQTLPGWNREYIPL